MKNAEISGGAILSDCGKYRYYLQRTWDDKKPRLCWVMLNPSVADHTVNDATIRVCMGRAALTGYGGIDVVNLFAIRSTDPAVLYDLFLPTVSEPSAPDKNDEIIRRVVHRAGMVICAWGKHGSVANRGEKMLATLHSWGVHPFALKRNADGSPAHPLRIAYSVEPFKL